MKKVELSFETSRSAEFEESSHLRRCVEEGSV